MWNSKRRYLIGTFNKLKKDLKDIYGTMNAEEKGQLKPKESSITYTLYWLLSIPSRGIGNFAIEWGVDISKFL